MSEVETKVVLLSIGTMSKQLAEYTKVGWRVTSSSQFGTGTVSVTLERPITPGRVPAKPSDMPGHAEMMQAVESARAAKRAERTAEGGFLRRFRRSR